MWFDQKKENNTWETIEASPQELACASWVSKFNYEKYKRLTYAECVREKSSITRILRSEYEIEDKKELKYLSRLLDYIIDRKWREYLLRNEEIPEVIDIQNSDVQQKMKERVAGLLKK